MYSHAPPAMPRPSGRRQRYWCTCRESARRGWMSCDTPARWTPSSLGAFRRKYKSSQVKSPPSLLASFSVDPAPRAAPPSLQSFCVFVTHPQPAPHTRAGPLARVRRRAGGVGVDLVVALAARPRGRARDQLDWPLPSFPQSNTIRPLWMMTIRQTAQNGTFSAASVR